MARLVRRARGARRRRTSSTDPAILRALEPALRAAASCSRTAGIAFVALGAVVLCVTGAEALYADMGHFGKRPIRIAWFGLVMPALVLNYFGQGALLLAHPESGRATRSSELAPDWALLPAGRCSRPAPTVIASQALISGAFSMTKQAIQLGYLPRMRVMHTSVARDRPDLPAGRQLGAVRAASCSRWCCSARRDNARPAPTASR